MQYIVRCELTEQGLAPGGRQYTFTAGDWDAAAAATVVTLKIVGLTVVLQA